MNSIRPTQRAACLALAAIVTVVMLGGLSALAAPDAATLQLVANSGCTKA